MENTHIVIEKIGMGTKPDPFKFEILKTEYFGGCTIILARYEGCKTFSGKKILVLRGIHEDFKTLDPHFFEGYPVVARFIPNDLGWKLARNTASWFGYCDDGTEEIGINEVEEYERFLTDRLSVITPKTRYKLKFIIEGKEDFIIISQAVIDDVRNLDGVDIKSELIAASKGFLLQKKTEHCRWEEDVYITEEENAFIQNSVARIIEYGDAINAIKEVR